MSPELALALLKYTHFIIGTLKIAKEIKESSLRNLERIQALVEAGEDASEEDIAAELAYMVELTTSAEAILEQRKAAAGE